MVLDDFIAAPRDAVLQAFPRPDWPTWRRFSDDYQRNKCACGDISLIPQLLRDMLTELNGPEFLSYLERVTGIRGLIPDPYLAGGGLHSSGPGGVLAPHADFHQYGRLALFRRINVLVYLNPEWDAADGGMLELYERGTKHAAVEILPLYGRMVMFLTDDRSIHGFSRPVAAGRWRNSLALYYYTAEPPPRYSGDSDTHWQAHGSHGAIGTARLFAYKALMRVAHLLSRAAHAANPNFRSTIASRG